MGGFLIELVGFVDVAVVAEVMVLAAVVLLSFVLQPSPYERTRLATMSPNSVDGRGVGGRSLRNSLWTLAQDRVFLALCAAVALFELTADQWAVVFPLYVNTVLGVPYVFIGAGLALNGIVVVVGQVPMTRAALGRRHTSLLVAGGLLYVVGFLLLGLPPALGVGVLAAFFSSVLVVTLGENLQSIPLTTLPSNLAPEGEIGAYNGAFFSAGGRQPPGPDIGWGRAGRSHRSGHRLGNPLLANPSCPGLGSSLHYAPGPKAGGPGVGRT